MLVQNRWIARFLSVLSILILLLGSLLIKDARAVSTIIVDSTADDTIAGNGLCTLREAINNANSNSDTTSGDCVSGSSGVDTINFDYSLSGDTITLGSTITIDGDLNIDGGSLGSHIVISGGGTVRLFTINTGIVVSLIHLDLINGYSSEPSGAGAIYNGSGADLTIDNCTVSGHTASHATGPGGAITNIGDLEIIESTFENNQANSGGAIYSSGTMNIGRSTFSGNTAVDGSAIYDAGELYIYNTTFYGNEVTGVSPSGAYNAAGTSATFNNCTFSDNTATTGLAAGLVKIAGTGTSLNLKNTILANSSASYDCYVTGGLSSDVNNLIESHNGCGTPISTEDPLLDELWDNGGPTDTVALGPGSPAIDAGDPSICSDSGDVNNLDQRGITRPIDADLDGTPTCDIGAYETQVRFVATSGSDSGNYCENSGSPCATVTHALSWSKRGDVISIGTGTYAEGSQLNLSKYVDLVGAGMNQTFLDGGGTHRVMFTNTIVRLKDLTVQNGFSSTTAGAGIYNGGTLTLESVQVDNNTVSHESSGGGGIYSSDQLYINDSIISNNAVTGTGQPGGGLLISGGGSSAVITNSTISGNTATGSSGGLHNQGTGTLDLTNVTISGNTAFAGGGMINTNSSTATLLNCTITDNHLLPSGYAGGIANYSTINIKNTIVAGNDGYQCTPQGTWVSEGNNLGSDTKCNFTATGDIESVDPLLGVLADNGGETPTHALLTGSPAIDAGTNSGCPATDQRGVARPQGTDCDIGAYESEVVDTQPPMADFNGDGDTDFSFYRPSNGYWYYSDDGTPSWTWFGAEGTDIIVPGDYNGDGDTDFAYYRPSNGYWYVKDDGVSSYTWWGAAPTDILVPGDYNGDGDTDFAYYRPSTGFWYVKDDGVGSWTWWGAAPTDILVPGDYNGDGDTDFAYFRPSNGFWYVKDDGIASWEWWGAAPTDVLVPGDFNGDGDTDLAYYRPSNGFWYVKDDGVPSWEWWGATPTDVLVPGDYNGDGDTDFAYYRPSNGFWYVKDDGSPSWSWFGAAPDDLIIPGDINGDGVPW